MHCTRKNLLPTCFLMLANISLIHGLFAKTNAEPKIIECVDIEKVWAGHPVGFSLMTKGNKQFVAYYDAQRRMSLASRSLGDKKWTIQHLASTLGWDSHNYVTIAFDRNNHIHVSGNMHVNSLVYFRSEKPLDVTSIKPVHRMSGKYEKRVTYPRFFHDANGRLLFMYRDGASGNGMRYLNAYDEKTKTWKQLLNAPLLNGAGKSMNAYPHGPVKGPDGWFHLVWMWRNSGDCSSNHDISYVRSKDLVHWETAGGKKVPLPITPDRKEAIVDPQPPRHGMINMGFGVGFDDQKRAVIHYHRYDANGKGNSQIFLARWEQNRWAIRAASNWKTRWSFKGGGSISSEIGAGSVRVLADGSLVQPWWHNKLGRGTWKLDPTTLKSIGQVTLPPRYPGKLTLPESKYKTHKIGVRWRSDSGEANKNGIRYFIRWESLAANRDRARKGTLPKPMMLRVYGFKYE